jgi:hypothetical protein
LDQAGRRFAETDELAEGAQLAAASINVRPVIMLALECLTLSVNLGAGCDRAVLSGLAFGDLELNGANSTIDRGEVGFEESVEEVARETLNCVLEQKDGDPSAVEAI